MLMMLFKDIEKKLKEAGGKIDLKLDLEYSGREFTHIDINGVYYIDKTDDSEADKEPLMIMWYNVPPSLSMKIYNYVMEIK